MHYVNVVGIDNNEVVILNTDNTLEVCSRDNFRELMDLSSYCFISGTYKIIRFYNSKPSSSDIGVDVVIRDGIN